MYLREPVTQRSLQLQVAQKMFNALWQLQITSLALYSYTTAYFLSADDLALIIWNTAESNITHGITYDCQHDSNRFKRSCICTAFKCIGFLWRPWLAIGIRSRPYLCRPNLNDGLYHCKQLLWHSRLLAGIRHLWQLNRRLSTFTATQWVSLNSRRYIFW
jgi:hypothetical protein